MGNVRSAYEVTVEALAVAAADSAAVELGRTLADCIDDAELLEGEARTKALYLAPHLMNVLKELLATPAARKAVGLGAKEATGGKLASLRSIEGSRKARTG